eukprot:6196999-Pleurochrysis_carterae.AAC.1
MLKNEPAAAVASEEQRSSAGPDAHTCGDTPGSSTHAGGLAEEGVEAKSSADPHEELAPAQDEAKDYEAQLSDYQAGGGEEADGPSGMVQQSDVVELHSGDATEEASVDAERTQSASTHSEVSDVAAAVVFATATDSLSSLAAAGVTTTNLASASASAPASELASASASASSSQQDGCAKGDEHASEGSPSLSPPARSSHELLRLHARAKVLLRQEKHAPPYTAAWRERRAE